MMNRRWRDPKRPVDPVAFTFIASLVLTVIAVATGSLNRDGMLYVEAADAFIAGGLPAAKTIFSWPLLPVIMGSLSMATGLSPEWCGHLLNALFMAGACALTVSMIRREEAGLAWFGVAVVLALPGLNEYRNELIREYGCWFFTMLAFRLALEWPSRPTWRLAASIQAAIVAAALFRPEAAAFFVSILLWQHNQPSPAPRTKRALLLGTLPLAALIAIIAAHFAGLLPATSRLATEVSRFTYAYPLFDQTAQGIAQALNPYARNEQKTAHAILFFGSIALVPWKFLVKLGVFVIPFWFFLRSPMRQDYSRRFGLLSWALALHGIVLCIFALHQQFLAGRYIAPLLLFSAPFLAHGLQRLSQHLSRWQLAVPMACAILAILNVVGPVGEKRYFREAGQWLKDNQVQSSRIYIHDARIAHFAGWGVSKTVGSILPEESIKAGVSAGRFDILVMHITKENRSFEEWGEKNGLKELKRFPGKAGKTIVIYSATPAGPNRGESAPPR